VDLFSSKLNPVRRVADPENRQSLRQHRCTQANGPTAPRLRAPDPSTATKLEESSVAVDPSTWRRNGCFVWVAIPRSCTSGPSLSDNNILTTPPLHPLVFLSPCSYLPCLFVCVLCVLFFQSFKHLRTRLTIAPTKFFAASRSVSSPSLFCASTLGQNALTEHSSFSRASLSFFPRVDPSKAILHYIL
jgi:hypothetical protein